MLQQTANKFAINSNKDDIRRRLDELNKWQTQQQTLLQERQNLQRLMLDMEQKKMYETLGLSQSDSSSIVKNAAEQQERSEYADIMRRTHGHGDEPINAMNTKNASAEAPTKRKFLRRGEGIKQRYGIDPEQLRLDNLPRYKYAKAHAKLRASAKENKSAARPVQQIQHDLTLDSDEQQFKLIFKPAEHCKSTPDIKTALMAKAANENLCNNEQSITETVRDSPKKSVCWAKVLDSQNIKPVNVRELRQKPNQAELSDYTPNTNVDDDDLSLFELLERKANEGSFSAKGSFWQQYVLDTAEQDNNNEVDETLNSEEIRTAVLEPAVEKVKDFLSNSEDEVENASELQVDYDTPMPPPYEGAEMVYFEASTERTEQESTNLAEQTSAYELFNQFKAAIFTALQSKTQAVNETEEATTRNETATPTGHLEEEVEKTEATSSLLQEKMDMVKERLQELEREVAIFKENNLQLLKAKQQHELEKMQYDAERLEALEKLKDEKVQMEIYLHDERMKIEDEKKKCEMQLQLQKSTLISKNKKEIMRLEQELMDAQLQLKQKEQNHLAAQGRLRAQMRNMEKDQKFLQNELERLKLENKRLQAENAKIQRESNKNIIKEINRNIAKLAPKMPTESDTSVPAANKHKKTNVPKREATRLNPKKPAATETLKTKQKQQTSSELDDIADAYSYEEALQSDPSNYQDADACETTLNQARSSKRNKTLTNKANSSESLSCSSSSTAVDFKTTSSQQLEHNNSSQNEEFKREIINDDGSKNILYPNGNIKKISADGMVMRMLYFNRDIKETNVNEGTVKYYYAETNTWHTEYLDGLEILEFPDGTVEHRHKNGTVEIHFPNDIIRISDPNDDEKLVEWRYPTGETHCTMRNGDEVTVFPNGQREVHTKEYQRREYPDGTVKIQFKDGSQETRYSHGRLRLRDKNGTLIVDRMNN